jgi:hypothetical protein
MALFTDHISNARQMLSGDADARPRSGVEADAARAVLTCRPPPSRRLRRAMPHMVCVRLAGAWIGALTLLLLIVLAIRWSL